MGHIRETEGEVLVSGTVPGSASVRNDLRKLSDALHTLTSGRAPPDLPADRALQVNGGTGDDVDGGRADAVPGAGTGGPDKLGGGPIITEQVIEEVVCRYGCVGKIVADRGELDAKEAEKLFDHYGLNSHSPWLTIRRQTGRWNADTGQS